MHSASDSAGWPLLLGIALSILVVPVLLYLRLVVRPPLLAGGSWSVVGLVAMLPGFLMGGLGLWTAARG